jgi:rod shape-determining protein MreD
MNPAFWQQLDVLARKLTPFGLAFVLTILSIIPLPFEGYARVAPLLPLMAVYHWGIYRPQLFPAYAAFLIGLLEDSLSGTPMGENALVYLLIYGLVISQRTFFVGKSFAIYWLGFAFVVAGAMMASWILISLFHATPVGGEAVFFQFLLTLGCFPLVAWFFMRWQRAFLGEV